MKATARGPLDSDGIVTGQNFGALDRTQPQ